jgi:hypothetical protein
MALEAAVAMSGPATARHLLNAVEAFHTELEHTPGVMPHDGERYRHGERLRTGGGDSTVTPGISQRCCTQPPRAWPPRGAPLLRQLRTRVVHGAGETTFRAGSPGFRAAPPPVAA